MKFFTVVNSLVLAVCSLTSVAFASAQGGDHSGGGNACLLDINAAAKRVIDTAVHLTSLDAAQVSRQKFKDTLSSAQFQLGENLTKNGQPVDALNYPDSGLIVIDKTSCPSLLSQETLAFSLIVHETLGLMRVDDSNYKVSLRAMSEIKQLIPPAPFGKVAHCEILSGAQPGTISAIDVFRNLDIEHGTGGGRLGQILLQGQDDRMTSLINATLEFPNDKVDSGELHKIDDSVMVVKSAVFDINITLKSSALGGAEQIVEVGRGMKLKCGVRW